MTYSEVANGKVELKKMLYFFVCNDDMLLNKMYDGDSFMTKVVKEVRKIASELYVLLFYPLASDELRHLDEQYYINEGSKQKTK